MTEESKIAEPAPEPKPKAPAKAKPKAKAAPEPEVVVFASYNEEPREFEINKIRARRNENSPGRIEWHVPAEMAERFAKHFHVQSGRVRQVE